LVSVAPLQTVAVLVVDKVIAPVPKAILLGRVPVNVKDIGVLSVKLLRSNVPDISVVVIELF
jgi:hypothetical protein